MAATRADRSKKAGENAGFSVLAAGGTTAGASALTSLRLHYARVCARPSAPMRYGPPYSFCHRSSLQRIFFHASLLLPFVSPR